MFRSCVGHVVFNLWPELVKKCKKKSAQNVPFYQFAQGNSSRSYIFAKKAKNKCNDILYN